MKPVQLLPRGFQTPAEPPSCLRSSYEMLNMSAFLPGSIGSVQSWLFSHRDFLSPSDSSVSGSKRYRSKEHLFQITQNKFFFFFLGDAVHMNSPANSGAKRRRKPKQTPVVRPQNVRASQVPNLYGQSKCRGWSAVVHIVSSRARSETKRPQQEAIVLRLDKERNRNSEDPPPPSSSLPQPPPTLPFS